MHAAIQMPAQRAVARKQIPGNALERVVDFLEDFIVVLRLAAAYHCASLKKGDRSA
jgi:hypothetical protein